jgi:hypothetical protein
MRMSMVNPPHYTPEDWVDFVRDVAPPEPSGRMPQRLTEADCQPPPSAVVVVGKMYPVSFRPVIPPGVGTLLFDSKSAVLAGVRTTQPAARNLLFGAGDFLIHVRIERAKPRKTIVITGQVMEMNVPEPRVSGRRVRALSNETVATVETNELGEFRLELADALDHLSLVVEFVGASLTIPLDSVMEVQP